MPSRKNLAHTCRFLLIPFLVIGLLLPAALAAPADKPLMIEGSQKSVNLVEHMTVFQDKTASYDIEQVRQLPASHWDHLSGDVFSGGYTDSAFWLKLKLRGGNSLETSSDYIFELDIAYLGYVDFYVVKNGVETVYKTGLARPYSQRPEASEIIILPIELSPGDEVTLHLRVESEGSVFVPATLWKRDAYYQNRMNKTLLFGGFFSLCLVLGIYNLFLFFSIREKSYLYYTLNNLAVLWFQASAHGFTVHYLWQDNFTSFAYIEPHLSLWLGFTTILLFANSFLKLHQYHPNFNKVFIGLICLCTVMGLMTVVSRNHRWIWAVFNAVSPIVLLTILTASIYSMVKGNRAARFFLLGWSFFLVTALIATFYYQGLMPDNAFTKYCSLYGSALEGILLSIALADRINWIQKEKTRAQQQVVEALSQANRLKDEFLLTISHELRTPLNGIIGAAILNRGEKDYSKLEENNDLISLSANRMAESIEDLLCLSELNAGVMQMDAYPFLFRQKLHDLIETVNAECEKKGLAFNVDMQAVENQYFLGDHDKIRNVLRQLLRNAIAYTTEGGVSLTITETESSHDQTILSFVVKDTGAGISESKLDIIFDAFQQASGGYSRDNEGLGIGLSICKRLVEMMGGSIHVESNTDQGALFEARLPLQRHEPVSDAEVAELTQDNVNQHVLLVEDNLVNRQILRKMLARLNCRV
ncbi:MAG: 7TM diverse intracellular signaling domain-containing protein, partial [Ketobacteraceae bacterium]|nr:7TM diverse intracellular signaling domain-containing protein [Ketobacteraceae bacterium]